jgi:hypothetical protein
LLTENEQERAHKLHKSLDESDDSVTAFTLLILLFRTRFRFFSSEDWGQVKPIPSVFLRISSLAHESLPDSTEEGTEEGTEDRCRLTSFLNVPPPEFVRVCPYPNSFVDDSLLALRLFFFRRLFFFFGIVTCVV